MCPLVISRKLSKIDRLLLRYTVRKLVSLILLPHSDPLETFPWEIFWFQMQNMFKYLYSVLFHLA